MTQKSSNGDTGNLSDILATKDDIGRCNQSW